MTLDPDVTAVLTIDLGALRRNYRALKSVVGSAECAAVVKADGYGIGMEVAVKALLLEGCRIFFVATLEEARQLRALSADSLIYVLNGLFPGTAHLFREISARPVLCSLTEIEEWAMFCQDCLKRLPAAIHIDTGMNRLGVSVQDVDQLAGRSDLFEAFNFCHVMSHLACADTPGSEKNAVQLELFQSLRAKLPNCSASIANSAGVLLGKQYHLDLVRTGIALYGGRSLCRGPNPMKAVVRLDGRIIQVRMGQEGETVGYGASRTLGRPTRIATVALGYGDGFSRLLGVSDTIPASVAYVGEHPVPLLGRVSMDLITLDVTDVPEELVVRGGFVELMGPHIDIDEIAVRSRTICYEVLTNLGSRYTRIYLGL